MKRITTSPTGAKGLPFDSCGTSSYLVRGSLIRHVSDRKKGGTSARAKISIPPIFPFLFPLLIKERILELVVGGPIELSKVVYLRYFL